MAAIAAEEALLLGRAAARGLASRGVRRAAMRGAARFFGRAYRTGSGFVKKNPFTAGTLAGYGLEKVRFGKKKKRKLSRPLPGPVKKPRVSRVSRIYPYGGNKFRKFRKPHKVTKYIKFKKDTSFQVTATNCGWIGIHGNGGFNEFVEAACAGIVRAILAECKFYPNSLDTQIYLPGSADTDTIEFITSYRGVNPNNGTVSTYTDTHSFVQGSQTFSQLVSDYNDTVQSQMVVGLYPDVVTVRNTTKNMHLARQLEIGKAWIEVNCINIVHLQNQTLASQSGTEQDIASALNIHSQPLTGKMYMFNHASAAVKPEVNLSTSIFEDQVIANGVWSANETTTGFAGNDRLLHPPQAKNVFENCKAVTNIQFQPGETKKQQFSLSFKGQARKLFDLLLRKHNAAMKSFTWGKQLVFCVERTVRHGVTNMEIGVNAERHISSYCKIKHHRAGITDYVDVQL